jgi:hypothetical protein
MQCPYCTSELDVNALVCKVCTKDVFLYKPLLEKIELLEAKVAELTGHEDLLLKVNKLEEDLYFSRLKLEEQNNIQAQSPKDLLIYLVLPLVILLASHALITIIYDLNMVYLRVISFTIPLIFSYHLFCEKRKSLFSWFCLGSLMAALAVFAMSTITWWVDQTPILPQNNLEIREFFEYALSILLSYFTGMLLGSVQYTKRYHLKARSSSVLINTILNILTSGKLSPSAMHKLLLKVNEYGATVVALCSTLLSIYTGLKALS